MEHCMLRLMEEVYTSDKFLIHLSVFNDPVAQKIDDSEKKIEKLKITYSIIEYTFPGNRDHAVTHLQEVIIGYAGFFDIFDTENNSGNLTHDLVPLKTCKLAIVETLLLLNIPHSQQKLMLAEANKIYQKKPGKSDSVQNLIAAVRTPVGFENLLNMEFKCNSRFFKRKQKQLIKAGKQQLDTFYKQRISASM